MQGGFFLDIVVRQGYTGKRLGYGIRLIIKALAHGLKPFLDDGLECCIDYGASYPLVKDVFLDRLGYADSRSCLHVILI